MEFIEKHDNTEKIYSVSYDKEKLTQLLDEIVKKTSTRCSGEFHLPHANEWYPKQPQNATLPNGDPRFEDLLYIRPGRSRDVFMMYIPPMEVYGTRVFSPKLAYIIRDILLEKTDSIIELLNYDSSSENEGLDALSQKILEANERVNGISNYDCDEKLKEISELKKLIEARKAKNFDVGLLEQYYLQAKALIGFTLESETIAYNNSKS